MRARSVGLGGWSAVVVSLLWAPLVGVAWFSFRAAPVGGVSGGWTLAWYGALWRHEAALRAAGITFLLAFASTAIATVLGTLLGHGLGRRRWRGGRWAAFLLQLPILVPDIVLAVSLVLWFGLLREWTGAFPPGLGTMILGHVSFQVPFVALVVRARTSGLDPSLEEAARDLGATPWQAFRTVTLPLLRPGIVAGALLAFTLSLDDFAVSFFLGGPGTTTLPVLIYASARRGVTPDLHALSTLLMALTLLLVVAARGWGRRGRGRP